MKTIRLWACLMVPIVIILVSCNSTKDENGAINASMQISESPLAKATSEPTLKDIFSNLITNKNVQYDEILQTVQYIAYNYPGSLDGEPSQEMRAYLSALRGKHIENWEGWVYEYLPYDEERSSYDLTISIVQPQAGVIADIPITLEDVTPIQVEQLQYQNNKALIGPWERIQFSGEISAVWPWGRIILSQVELKKNQ